MKRGKVRAYLPVRPQMPILEPVVILKDMFLRAGEFGLPSIRDASLNVRALTRKMRRRS
jgi:hypothetical protein